LSIVKGGLFVVFMIPLVMVVGRIRGA